jgi:hypothetical protein
MTYIPNQEAYNKIVDFLGKGEAVSAVRFVRDDGKIGLKAAKMWVDDFIETHYLPMKDILVP